MENIFILKMPSGCRALPLYRGGGGDPDTGQSRIAGQRNGRRRRRDSAARLRPPVTRAGSVFPRNLAADQRHI